MGYVPFDRLDSAYKSIKKAALGGPGEAPSASSLLIFVAPDVDAVCALKILVTLLKADCIAHKVYPIAGYRDLAQANEDLVADNAQLRSIFMLNCGGLVDLDEWLDLAETVTVYVADSHRPLVLHSLYGTDRVVVLDDGDLDSDRMREIKDAFEVLEFEQEEEDEGDSEGSEDEGFDEEKSDEEEEGVEEDEAGKEEAEGPENGDPKDPKSPNKRKRESNGTDASALRFHKKKRKESRRREELKDLLRNYYNEGTSYGMSTAGLMYTMATQLGRSSADLLWLSIIGLTDQYLQDRVSSHRYNTFVDALKEEVRRYDVVSESQDISDIDSLFGEPIGGLAGESNGAARSADDRTIRCEKEFRLMLLRHWNLYDSMYHSPYVASKMGIWVEKGRKRLINCIVKMGLPHTEASQNYSEMSLSHKRTLNAKLLAMAESNRMRDIVFPSFNRVYGYKGVVSAADAVYALGALLDCGEEWVRNAGNARFDAAEDGDHPLQIGSRAGR
ncbi:hypothetical protein HK104_004085, partial [Borealophlyctis nickersoniae]